MLSDDWLCVFVRVRSEPRGSDGTKVHKFRLKRDAAAEATSRSSAVQRRFHRDESSATKRTTTCCSAPLASASLERRRESRQTRRRAHAVPSLQVLCNQNNNNNNKRRRFFHSIGWSPSEGNEPIDCLHLTISSSASSVASRNFVSSFTQIFLSTFPLCFSTQPAPHISSNLKKKKNLFQAQA